jgi:hypothetical protein
LGDAANLGAGGQGDRPCIEPQLAPDDLEQRGLARTIAAHKAHFVTFGDDGAGLFKQRAALDGVIDF